FGALSMVTKGALEAYASYEQLTGGVETLFKESAPVVEEYAANAYKTASMSANDYMETATSFSASLLQGLGGDTAAAAEYANTAITDMSDNANKMGTNISSIQDAYQGFAKQNYTMLDNLKLGYGGTQSEMARLINDSGVLGDTMTVTAENVNEVSFDKVVEAIHVVQTEMGITGTTALEASTTIEGSVNSAKAAWANWLVGLADDNANIEQLTAQLVESVSIAAGNIVPRLVQIVSTLGTVLVQQLPAIFGQLQAALGTYVPQLLSAAGMLFASIGQALIESGPSVLAYLLSLINQMTQYMTDNLPTIMAGAGAFFSGIFTALVENVPTILQGLVDLCRSLCQYIIDNRQAVVDAAFDFISGIVPAILQAAPQIIGQLALMLAALIATVVGKVGEMIAGGAQMIGGMVSGFFSVNVLGPINDIINSVIGAFSGAGSWLWNAGSSILQGLWDGISSGIGWLGDQLAGIGDFIVQHKGPPEKDKVLLSGNGSLIMDGLVGGIVGGIPALQRALAGVGDEISGYEMSATASLAATGAGPVAQGGASASSVALTSQMYMVMSQILVALQEFRREYVPADDSAGDAPNVTINVETKDPANARASAQALYDIARRAGRSPI
ncbi:phage tail protein, partial [Gordonibacter sp.]